jgi:hypothetical protein
MLFVYSYVHPESMPVAHELQVALEAKLFRGVESLW